MEPIYEKKMTVDPIYTDRFDRLKPSALLHFAQEAAGEHCALLQVDSHRQNLFWAVIRHRVQITRLPKKGEQITLQTWPMPTTRTAYPRSVIACDERGQELFRTVSLWVLMDPESRAMVLPGKSGVEVNGILRGTELTAPGSLIPATLSNQAIRRVCFTDLDINGHMNNCRYLDWAEDLLPSSFHGAHPPREMTLCYLSEAREGNVLEQNWCMEETGLLRLEITREGHRVFAARVEYETEKWGA